MCVTYDFIDVLHFKCSLSQHLKAEKSFFSNPVCQADCFSFRQAYTHARVHRHTFLSQTVHSFAPSIFISFRLPRSHTSTHTVVCTCFCHWAARTQVFLLSFSFSFSLSPPPAHFCDFNSLSLWHRSCHIAKTHEHNGEVNPFNATSPRKQSLVNHSDASFFALWW